MDIRTEITNNVLQALADQQQEVQERVEAALKGHVQSDQGYENPDRKEKITRDQ